MQFPNKVIPGPGQESVWDYPRPPHLEPVSSPVKVIFNGVVIAETTHAKRVLETSHPPVYYIPPEDIRREYFTRTEHASVCEWKGQAAYYTIAVGDQEAANSVWFYPNPTPSFFAIKDHLAFYPSRMDACFVGDEQVTSQPGDFYGGWITKNIVGPFKGDPGTWGW